MKGHSDTVSQMRLTENPGSVGSESTGVSISGADEVERLRYVVNRIVGGTYWYDAPSTNINALASVFVICIILWMSCAINMCVHIRPVGLYPLSWFLMAFLVIRSYRLASCMMHISP